MRIKTSRLAFLLGLVSIAAASQAVDVTLTLTSTVDLNNAVFAYKATAPGLDDQNGALLGDISAGTYSATATLAGDLSQYDSYRYTLLSTYTSPVDSHVGVVIGLNPAATLDAVGNSFESVFNVAEDDIVNAINGVYDSNPFVQLLAFNTLTAFANDNLSKLPIGLTGGSLVAFSDGVAVGTVQAAPVPEPASMVALGLGVAALARRRRRS